MPLRLDRFTIIFPNHLTEEIEDYINHQTFVTVDPDWNRVDDDTFELTLIDAFGENSSGMKELLVQLLALY